MGIIQMVMERPGLEHMIAAQDFRDPLRLLASEHDYLRRVLECLARLVDDMHARDREQLAGCVLDYVSMDLNWLSADHEDLVAALERKPAVSSWTAKLSLAVVKEHAAMRRLIPHVIHGLRLISAGALPDDPRAFAVGVLVFCELAKLHTDYEDAALLPLAKRALMADELGDIAVDMAFRRGMAVV